MLDGLSKHLIDPVWEKIATPFVRLRATPNQMTVLGLGLVLLVSLAYLWHKSTLIFGLTLAIAFAFDSLDGAVARARQMETKFGGYLDAVVDRYQELLVFLVIGLNTGYWLLVFLALTGGVFTSYAKARTAIEAPVSNNNWPDLFERLERVLFLCTLLVLDGAITALWGHVAWIMPTGLGVYAVLAHATALQRAARAARYLRAFEPTSPAPAKGLPPTTDQRKTTKDKPESR